jgi:ABC-type nitrate/sulfonate/bicarbonate transport system permease component
VLYNYRFYQRSLDAKKQAYVTASSAVLLLASAGALVYWGPGLKGVSSLLATLGITFLCVVAAYVLALATAIFLLLCYKVPVVREVLYPILNIGQSIPSVAWLLILFVYPAAQDLMVVPVLAIAMVWPIFFTVADGASNTMNTELSLVARSLGANGWRGMRYFYLPILRKYFISGSLLAWGEAWSLILAFEIIADVFGIGDQLAQYIQYNSIATLGLWIALYTLIIFISEQVLWIPLLRKYGEATT